MVVMQMKQMGEDNHQLNYLKNKDEARYKALLEKHNIRR